MDFLNKLKQSTKQGVAIASLAQPVVASSALLAALSRYKGQPAQQSEAGLKEALLSKATQDPNAVKTTTEQMIKQPVSTESYSGAIPASVTVDRTQASPASVQQGSYQATATNPSYSYSQPISYDTTQYQQPQPQMNQGSISNGYGSTMYLPNVNQNMFNPQGYMMDYSRLLAERSNDANQNQGLYSIPEGASPEQVNQIRNAADNVYAQRMAQVGQYAGKEWSNVKDYGTSGMYGGSSQGGSQASFWNPLSIKQVMGGEGVKMADEAVSQLVSNPTVQTYKLVNNAANAVYTSDGGKPSVASVVNTLPENGFVDSTVKNILIETLAKTIQPGLAVNDSIYDANGNPNLSTYGDLMNKLQPLLKGMDTSTVTGLPAKEAKHILSMINTNNENMRKQAKNTVDSVVNAYNQNFRNAGVNADISMHPNISSIVSNIKGRENMYETGNQNSKPGAKTTSSFGLQWDNL
jgi:hypothetical protein